MNPAAKILLVALLALVPLPARAEVPLPALAELEKSGLRVTALFSVDGKSIASISPDRRLNPASVTKLFTAAVAVDAIGPDRRFNTSVYRGDGVIYIEGSGDPELTTRELEQLASCVAADSRGPFRKLVFSTGPFSRDDMPPGYSQKNTTAAYRASVAGLQVNRNAVSISVGRAAPGATPPVKVTPMSDYVRIVNNAKASAAGKEGTAQRRKSPLVIDTRTDPDGRLLVTISGRSNPSKSTGVTARVDNPAWNAAASFMEALKKRGVSVSNTVPVRGPVAAGVERICFVPSPRLGDILVPMLKDSVNPIAESVLRLVGAEGASGQVGFSEGAAKLSAFMRDKVGADSGSFSFTNGSGLYGANSVSAGAVVALVHWILGNRPVMEVVRKALPTGGVDGTLEGRFRQESIRGRVHAKTGTLDTAISLAGWVDLPDGRFLEFAVLVEGDGKLKAAQVRQAIDSSVVKVSGSVPVGH